MTKKERIALIRYAMEKETEERETAEIMKGIIDDYTNELQKVFNPVFAIEAPYAIVALRFTLEAIKSMYPDEVGTADLVGRLFTSVCIATPHKESREE